jgi:hypothetical protein
MTFSQLDWWHNEQGRKWKEDNRSRDFWNMKHYTAVLGVCEERLSVMCVVSSKNYFLGI